MDKIPYILEAGTLNQTYNKIKNCVVVKPSFELDWSYSNEFFLDKRLGLISEFHDDNKTFYDTIDIKWVTYYLYKEAGKHYIWSLTGASMNVITPGWFTVDDKSPLRLALGRWTYGANKGTLTIDAWITLETSTATTFDSLPGYTGGYVRFHVTGTLPSVWDYITFTSGVLAGGTNKILKVDAGNIYIIGTNARGSMPIVGTTMNVYSDTATTLLVGHTGGVSLIILNGNNAAGVITVLATDNPIVDIVNFDWNLFAMTESHVYFSRSTFDDNTQFYPLDYYAIDLGYKLFPIGKAMIVFWRQNKLIGAANSTGTTLGYVMYDANYNGDMYSKYSHIFSDQTIYILQDDGQLMQVDLVQNNNTSFNVAVRNILTQNRWKFDFLKPGGDIYISSSSRYLNFLYLYDWNTTNIQYDKQYTHWIDQEYLGKDIYMYWKWKGICAKGYIYSEGGYVDHLIDYKQEVNFSVNGNDQIFMPYVIRTLFGLLPNHLLVPTEPEWIFDVDLDIKFDLWWKIKNEIKDLKDYKFDLRLSNISAIDDLIWWGDPIENAILYNGNVVSIQTWIYKTWRYIYFRYTSSNRFIVWHSYVFMDKTKPFINELDLNT